MDLIKKRLKPLKKSFLVDKTLKNLMIDVIHEILIQLSFVSTHCTEPSQEEFSFSKKQ